MQITKRTIDFFNIANFMIEVERIQNRELKDKEFIIAPLLSDSAKIWDFSYGLIDTGIHKGMELAMAKRLCGNIPIVVPNPDLYKRVHEKILFKLSKLTPILETEKIGRIYLDFTGFEKLYGSPQDFGKKIIKEIEQEFSFHSRIGISSNKLISKAATDTHFTNQDLVYVKKSEMSDFLDPFPSLCLPAVKEFKKKVGVKELTVLDDLNLEVIIALKVLDVETLEVLFPTYGEIISNMSHGIDNRPVLPPKYEDILIEDIHLEETNERLVLLKLIFSLADNVCQNLRRKNKSFSRFKIALRYSDYRYVEKNVELGFFAQYSYEIYEELKKSFSFLFSRRVKVRYLYLELGKLEDTHCQLSMFEDSRKKVFDTLDMINGKFPESISLGRIPR